ncbi:MAG: class I SAM-dependent methyltransferase [Anaerolineae bacterium]
MEDQAYQQMQQMQQRHWWWRGMRRLYARALRKYLPAQPANAPRRLVDVGCGFGANLPVLSEFGEVVAVDVSLDALRAIRANLPASKNMLLVEARADQLPFRADAFDVTALLAVIEHVDDDARVISESYRVTKPGGLQMQLTSAFMLLWSHHDVANEHKRRYRAKAFDALQRAAGWHVLRTTYVNALLFPAVLIVRLLQRWQDRRGQFNADSELEGRYDMGPALGPFAIIPEAFLAAEAWWFCNTSLPLPFGVDVFSICRHD